MAGWDIISAINDSRNLLPIVQTEMGTGRVSDTMANEAGNWFKYQRAIVSPPKPILIKAPTGSGKSTFVMKNLAEIVKRRGGRVLLLTNRKALCLQQRIIGNANTGLPRLGTSALLGNPIWDNIDIITYQEAISYITHNLYGTINQIQVVVCDEAHFFCSDSTFNAHTSDILSLLIEKFFWVQRVYMTATPENVTPIIQLEEKQRICLYTFQCFQQEKNKRDALLDQHEEEKNFWARQGQDTQCLINRQQQELQQEDSTINNLITSGNNLMQQHHLAVYSFADCFPPLRLHFFHEWESIVRDSKSSETNDKWLIFVKTKEKGEALKKALGSCSDFFNADSKGDDRKALHDLIRREHFEKKILIATTVLYNGVNFNDTSLKHIVVETVNKLELIQMLGRKRFNRDKDEVINLYVMVPKEQELSTYLSLTRKKLQLTKSYQRDPNGFFRDNWENGNIDDDIQKLFGVPNDFLGTSINMSFYAPYELGLEENMYETCLDLIKKGGHAFEEQICSWLHTDYSDEMKYDEDLEDMKGKIKPALIACFEKYKEKSPFSQETGKAFWKEIYDIVIPINETLKYHFRHLDSDGESRWQSDINTINKLFDLAYKVSGGKKVGYSVTLGTEKTIKGQSTDETDNPTEIQPESEGTETKET